MKLPGEFDGESIIQMKHKHEKHFTKSENYGFKRLFLAI
jgi:hypothetical protein